MRPGMLLGLCFAVIGCAETTQSAQRSEVQRRIAAVDIREERLLRWNEGGLPARPPYGVSQAMVFTGDGSQLVLQFDRFWYCIDAASGKVTELPGEPGRLVGVSIGSQAFASRNDGLARIELPGGERQELVAERLPDPRVNNLAPAMQTWAVSPDGGCALRYPYTPCIFDLERHISIPLAGEAQAASASWDAAGQRLVVSRVGVNGSWIEVYDRRGKRLAIFDGGLAYDLDPAEQYLWLAGASFCRGELATGKITAGNGIAATWFRQIDAVSGVGVHGEQFLLYDLANLEVVRCIPIDEPRPPTWTRTNQANPYEPSLVGCVLSHCTTMTLHGDRIALATLTGVRIYRVMH